MSHASLTDPFGRRIDYLRLSVTDRCDLRCGYCLPKGFKGFEEPAHWLTFAEIEHVVSAFTALGVRRVRLTGGEPLMRRGLTELAAHLSALPGLDDLSLSSNATRLESLAAPLARAGVRRLNVSLDSLNFEVFRRITGGDLARVLHGIAAACEAGMKPIRVNTVVMPGVNDTEIEDILDYCATRGFTLRLIETMPIGATGQAAMSAFGDLVPIKQRLEQRFELIPDILPGGGPARYYYPTRLNHAAVATLLRHLQPGAPECLGQAASLPGPGPQLSAVRPVACRDRRSRTPGASLSGDRPEA